MAEAGTVYCVDTSSLIHAWARAYPPKRFPALWAALDRLIDAGRLVASIEVYSELQKKDDDVFAWAKDRKEKLFRDIDEDVQAAVIDVMAKYPKLVDTSTGKSGGDPFVIAVAVWPLDPTAAWSPRKPVALTGLPKSPTYVGRKGSTTPTCWA